MPNDEPLYRNDVLYGSHVRREPSGELTPVKLLPWRPVSEAELAQLEREVDRLSTRFGRHERELRDAEAKFRRTRQHLSAAEGRLKRAREALESQPNT